MDLKTKKILNYSHVVIVIATLATCFYSLFICEGFGSGLIVDICHISAVIFSIFYALSGYKKDAAKHFHWFMASYAIAALISLIFLFSLHSGETNSVAIYALAFNRAVAYGILCILTVARDLGKKKSVVLGNALEILAIGAFFVSYITYPGAARGGIALYSQITISSAAEMCLATITNLMIVAKYKDKEARGSK